MGPEVVEYYKMLDPTGYAVWAWFTSPGTLDLVRVSRIATHEVPGSKWVEFEARPHTVLMNGTGVYAHPDFKESHIRCEWSDFLRLTRWRKALADRAPEEQACIARVKYNEELHGWVLIAIDHPDRHTQPSRP